MSDDLSLPDWNAGRPCPHKFKETCRLAAAIASVPKHFAPVTEQQCTICRMAERPTLTHPNMVVAAIANNAREGSAVAPQIEVGLLPEQLPCVHRSEEPFKTVPCRSCQNAGLSELPVYKCAKFGECVVRGYSLSVSNVCLTCADRQSRVNKAQSAENSPEAHVKHKNVTGIVFNREDQPADFLADQFAGYGCMLVCGGPSVADEDVSLLQQRGVFVAAISQVAATHVRPHVWFSVDQCKTYHASIWRDPAIMKFVARQHRNDSDLGRVPLNIKGEWTLDEPAFKCPNVWYYQRGDEWDLNTFLDRPYAMWRTTEELSKDRGKKSVMLVALRLLYWLGFRSVFIIGADFQMTSDRQYAFTSTKGSKACHSNNKTYAALNIAFQKLRPIFESRGLHVYNATAGGRLNAFERVSLEDATDACRAKFPKSMDVTGLYH